MLDPIQAVIAHCARTREYAALASIGVAMLDGTTESATDVMKRADAAMDAAEQEGRGTVRVLG